MKKILEITMYIYMFVLALLSLITVFSPFYFISDVKGLITENTVNNTCLLMFFEVGIFAGLSMLVPPLRKIYSILPWSYSFIRTAFFDVFIMGAGVQILIAGRSNMTISLIVMVLAMVILRIIMCMYLNRYKEEKSFKLFGTIILIIGFIGIMFYNGTGDAGKKISANLNNISVMQMYEGRI